MDKFDYNVYCKLVVATFIKVTDKLGLDCSELGFDQVYEEVESVYSDAADQVLAELSEQGLDKLQVANSIEVVANEVVKAVAKVVLA